VIVRRTAVLVAPLALLAVTACEKPAPQVTVSTGGKVVNVDASRYCFESDDCNDEAPEKATLRVRAADQISISVPARVAHKGWYIRFNGQPIPGFQKERKKLHGTLNLGGALDQPVELEIVQGVTSGEPQGVWKLTLAPRT
jgi:hypothetical protein